MIKRIGVKGICILVLAFVSTATIVHADTTYRYTGNNCMEYGYTDDSTDFEHYVSVVGTYNQAASLKAHLCPVNAWQNNNVDVEYLTVRFNDASSTDDVGGAYYIYDYTGGSYITESRYSCDANGGAG